MTFASRKRYGLEAQARFEAAYPSWRKNDCFAIDDYTTTTAQLPIAVKYAPDYCRAAAPTEYCEVKNSWYYNQAEYDYHAVLAQTHPFYVYIKDTLYIFTDLLKHGPYPGSHHGSGLPYYRLEPKAKEVNL